MKVSIMYEPNIVSILDFSNGAISDTQTKINYSMFCTSTQNHQDQINPTPFFLFSLHVFSYCLYVQFLCHCNCNLFSFIWTLTLERWNHGICTVYTPFRNLQSHIKYYCYDAICSSSQN
eukprot:874079_1